MTAFKWSETFKKHSHGSPLLIVEIGNDWIKLAEIDGSRHGVKKAHSVKLADLHPGVPKALAMILKTHRFSVQKVILCIPRHLVTIRILELPTVDSQEIRDMVNLQIGKQTPYLKEEILWAYKVLPSEGSGTSKVSLVIARRAIVQERLSILESAGIRVQSIFLSTEGVFQWFSRSSIKFSKEENIGVIDIDSNYADFLVVRKGTWYFSRSILLGANSLFENKNPENQQKFIQEIAHSCDLYTGEAEQSKVSRFLITGATENTHELTLQLQKTLNRPVEIIPAKETKDFFSKAAAGAVLNLPIVSWTAFLGYATTSPKLFLELAPPEMCLERAVHKLRSQLSHIAFMSVGLIVVFAVMMLINFQYKKSYEMKLNTEISKISDPASELERKREWIKVIEDRLDAKKTAVSILTQLFRKIPLEIYLTGLTFESNEKVTFKGKGKSMGDVLNFNGLLGKAGIFEKVPPPVYASKRIENNKETVEFEMVGYLKK